MEIEVGDYIRTKNGIIGKVIEINNEFNCIRIDKEILKYFDGDKNYPCFNKIVDFKDIVKHSKNIIDLIEEGDYVNGRLVLEVDYKNKNICLLIPLTDTKTNTNIMWYGYEDIKSITTKKQFNSIKYEIKEEN